MWCGAVCVGRKCVFCNSVGRKHWLQDNAGHDGQTDATPQTSTWRCDGENPLTPKKCKAQQKPNNDVTCECARKVARRISQSGAPGEAFGPHQIMTYCSAPHVRAPSCSSPQRAVFQKKIQVEDFAPLSSGYDSNSCTSLLRRCHKHRTLNSSITINNNNNVRLWIRIAQTTASG